uniref:Cell surface protein SprA n=1 Tax=Eiseniibacteriota bacterium TaxID=2212470 RepID=A0A832MK34_UNCEI
MHSLLTLPAAILLISFPGFGVKRAAAPAPIDTLPPAWKTPSRLALENEFVRAVLPPLRSGPVGLRLTADPRRLRLTAQPGQGTLSAVPELGDVALGAPARQEFREFARDLSARTFREKWAEESRRSINSAQPGTIGGTGTAQGFSFRLPSPLPKRVQSLLGPGGPALNVSGSENIRLSGQSNWTNQQIGPLGRKQSLFPSLDMQQDLDIRLEGQLSDRIRVNLLQNSGVAIPLANRLAINYKGDEDDLVQSLDLGNTNLSLPGTQYVSYSGRNEGLFGVKSSLRFGPLDLTVLASKQEGRSERASYAGGAATQQSSLADLDYVKGVYFFLYDPNDALQFIPNESIELYLDDFNYSNDIAGQTVRARALLDPTVPLDGSADSSSVRGSFQRLVQGEDADYQVLSNELYGEYWKVLRLRAPITGEQRLAVSYRARPVIGFNGTQPVFGPEVQVGGQFVQDTPPDTASTLLLKLLRAPASRVPQDENGLFDTTVALARTRELELRNVYQLPGRGIDPRSLKISIRRGVQDPPITFVTRNDTAITYLEILGLDNFDESAGPNTPGQDGRVDRPVGEGITRGYVDYENGILYFNDLRPFAPRLDRPFEALLDGLARRRARLSGRANDADDPLGRNTAIYDQYYVQRSQDVRYWIDVEFNAQRATGEISLGRGNLLEGSEVVTINGQPLARDRDYMIDYDLGRLTLKRQLGPSDQLNVNYSYAPLFASAGRTLIGSAFKLEGRDRQLGGAFMYESKGAQDLRPRLGEEPSRVVIGDLNTDLTFRPGWVTRLVDALPGVRTTNPSELRVQAEVGASFPNPNTRNEVYVDDMEGVRDAVGLSMDALRWRPSSVPRVADPRATDGRIASVPGRRFGELRWYSPPATVEERELKPRLTEAQGALNKRQVLAWSLPRRPATAAPTDTLFTGLTYVLDPVGLDLSRAQFIELWVNDFNDHHNPAAPAPRVRGRNVRLHVDLGAVSEDQQRSPDAPPNGRLDGEDREPFDGQLSVVSGNDEDTGLDGLRNADGEGAVLDLSTADANDPAGDDFDRVDEAFEDVDPRRYRRTNGTERNNTLVPVPDTEDLNGNYNLDREEDFFRWTIDLGDAAHPYLVTDVRRDYPPGGDYPTPGVDNGWRRYRIPITDSLRTRLGSPDLTLARHVRVWIDGVVETDETTAAVRRPFLMLGGLEIVGSRWQGTALTPAQRDTGTTLTINAINSVDNAEVYVPPFDPGSTRTASQELARREQSLVLEFTRLGTDDTLEVFKSFSVDENYSRYGKLAFYVADFDVRTAGGGAFDPTADTLWYFVRFASDEIGRNYYEYKARVPRASRPGSVQWSEVRLPLEAMSNLKLNPDFPLSGDVMYRRPGPFGGDSIVIRGRPSFTRLRRVSVGILNPPNGRPLDSGQLWFNELRATDVAKDRGVAQRVLVNGNLANLLRYNASWDGRDADFVTVGQSRGTGNSTEQLNLGGTFDLHRFFEATGIVLPVTVSYARSGSTPRFTAGDDVRRSGALADVSRTSNESRSFSTSYTRQWSDRAHPLLRLTLGGVTASYSRNQGDGRNPTGTTWNSSEALAVNYGIAPRPLWSFRAPLLGGRIHPLPERVYWNYLSNRVETRSFQRTPDGSGLVPSSATSGRTATVNFGGSARPVDPFGYRVEGVRNLTLGDLNERLGPVNLGRVVSWRQNADFRYSLNRGAFLNPTLTWGSSYVQDNRPELSRDLSVRAISNGQNIALAWALPFDRLVARAPRAGAAGLRPGAPGAPAAPPPAGGAGAPDSAARRTFDWRAALARLGNVSLDASFNRGSSYSRLTGSASPAYLFGLTDDPGLASDSSGGRMRAQFGNVTGFSRDWRTSGRTRLLLPLDAAVTTRAEASSRRTENNGVVNRSVQSRFPDFDVDYGRVATALRLNRVFTSPRLRTAYSRSRNTDYRNRQDQPNSISTSSQWQPLLGLDGDLKNQWRVKLQVQRRVTQSERFQLGHSVQTDRNTDINLDLSRTLTRGQKIKILNRESTIRSTITMTLSGVYSRRSGETRQVDRPDLKPQFPVDQDRLSVNGTGSYQFSSNVTGNASLGFGQTRDIQRGIIQRNVRVELRASFNF